MSPGEDTRYLLASLVVVIVGGMGSVGGAAIGALLIGLAEQFGLAYAPTYSVVFTFVIIVVDTRAGVRSVDRSLIDMAKSFGASEASIWQRILLPGALPAIIAGLRVGLGRAFTGMVLAELLLVGVGVGRLMLKYRGSFDSDFLYATILVVVVEAIVCTLLLRALENRVLTWASDAST